MRDFSLLEIVFSREKTIKRKRARPEQDETESLKWSGIPWIQRLLGSGDDVSEVRPERELSRKIVVVGKQLLFVGSSSEGGTFSEFNFGAGEASILRMVAEIEYLPESSLVLIEEVENGLHPLAVTRLVEYLIEVAERKKLQVIFTTHSEYALMPLPSEGIWASVNGELIRGHLSIESLRAITGRFDKQVAVFCEDIFARSWLEAIFRVAFAEQFPLLGFYHLCGDGTAVKIHRTHNQDPSVETRSVCFIDGDSREKEDVEKLVFRLPGESPERHVFDGVCEVLDVKIAVLTAGVQVPLSEQKRVKEIVDKVRLTNRDPHLLYSQVGEQLGLVAEEIVRGAFLAIWIDLNAEYVESVKNLVSPLIESQIAQGRR